MDHHRDKRARGSLGRRPDGPVLGLWQSAEHALELGQANGLRQGKLIPFQFEASMLMSTSP
jgi:hypothetical protein